MVEIEIEREMPPPQEVLSSNMVDIDIESKVPTPEEVSPLDMADIYIKREIPPPEKVLPPEVEFFIDDGGNMIDDEDVPLSIRIEEIKHNNRKRITRLPSLLTQLSPLLMSNDQNALSRAHSYV
ncbi:uncharacterized protein A4U43_C08F20560 [Asparagus officinalis]|nr:uncharacterized protein A4U43_C08F20560 [Asparagus officinalis]